MCVINGENGKYGADYGESSPRFMSSALWPDYMKPYEKFSSRIRQVFLDRPCPCVIPRRPSLNALVILWTSIGHIHDTTVGLFSS